MSAAVLAISRWILDSLGNSFRWQCWSGMAVVTVDNILFNSNERRKQPLLQRVTMALSKKMYGPPRYCKVFVGDAPACVNVSDF
jgi:hypothetical protein